MRFLWTDVYNYYGTKKNTSSTGATQQNPSQYKKYNSCNFYQQFFFLCIKNKCQSEHSEAVSYVIFCYPYTCA